jgi:CheY-like chemotaxis protein
MSAAAPALNTVDILLVEDNPDDILITREAFQNSAIQSTLHVAEDGIDAMRFLRNEERFAEAPRPDLILLDLNLPKKDGREVLAEIKRDKALKDIPVVVLTTSSSQEDILKSYRLHANCYITKPVDLNAFFTIVRDIESFWFTTATLPSSERRP